MNDIARTTTVTLDERYDLIARTDVTLNGQPAKISGARETFAMVRTLAPWSPQAKSLSATYAWHTVRAVCERDGAFRA